MQWLDEPGKRGREPRSTQRRRAKPAVVPSTITKYTPDAGGSTIYGFSCVSLTKNISDRSVPIWIIFWLWHLWVKI